MHILAFIAIGFVFESAFCLSKANLESVFFLQECVFIRYWRSLSCSRMLAQEVRKFLYDFHNKKFFVFTPGQSCRFLSDDWDVSLRWWRSRNIWDVALEHLKKSSKDRCSCFVRGIRCVIRTGSIETAVARIRSCYVNLSVFIYCKNNKFSKKCTMIMLWNLQSRIKTCFFVGVANCSQRLFHFNKGMHFF